MRPEEAKAAIAVCEGVKRPRELGVWGRSPHLIHFDDLWRNCKTMKTIKLLLLCHGDAHALDRCTTSVVPLSRKTLAAKPGDRGIVVTTLDMDESSEPDVHADWRKPTKLRAGSFHIVSTMCCMFTAFVSEDGSIVQNSFDNVARLLRPGGIFFFTLAKWGVQAYAKKARIRKGRRPDDEFERDVLKHIGRRCHPGLRCTADPRRIKKLATDVGLDASAVQHILININSFNSFDHEYVALYRDPKSS